MEATGFGALSVPPMLMKIAEPRVISRLNEPIGEARYSPAGDLLIGIGGAVGEHGCVCVWRDGGLDRVAQLSTDRPSVTSLAFSPNGQWFATACQVTDAVEIWDANLLRLAKSVKILPKPYRRSLAGNVVTETHLGDIKFSPDCRLLAAGCWDLTAKVVALETGTVKELAVPHERYNVDFVAFVSDGTGLITGTHRRLFTWDISAGTYEQSVDLGKDDIWQHLLLQDKNTILSLSHHGLIRLYRPDSWDFEEHAIRLKPQRLPPSLAYSPLSGLVAIGLFNGTVLFWDVAAGKLAGKFKCGDSPVVSLDFSPRGSAICVVTLSPSDRVVEYPLDL